MNSDDLKQPARPFLGNKRAVVQFAVAAAILAIFFFVAWASLMADR